MRFAVMLVACALALAACGDDEPDEPPAPPPEESPSGPEPDAQEPPSPAIERCLNDADGFAVEYPAAWHTNPGDVAPECSYFNPEPFEVPEATEFTDVAIEVRREPVPFARIAGEDPTIRVVEREQVEVAERPAIRRETEATGNGLLPRGTRVAQYLVDLDGETLVAVTRDLPRHDFERNREVMDEMVATLELPN